MDVSAWVQARLKFSCGIRGHGRIIAPDNLRQRILYTLAIAVHHATGEARLCSSCVLPALPGYHRRPLT